MPTEFALNQNYPNPFNPSTQISFSLPEASSVTLTVFDPLGRSVATLADGSFAAGAHELSFDASGLSNGIYFYQLQAGDFSAVRKLTLLK
ncbi:MAG: T9SS type A sorting domain-containing protein [bacterium]|nr:T9SS type A sorting domain-containing protein [bacterium]